MTSKKSLYIASAVVAAASMAAAPGAIAGAHGGKVKCYGAAKAGQNDCGTDTHECRGYAKTDCDPKEWIMVPKEACESMKAACKKGMDHGKNAEHHRKNKESSGRY